MANSRQTADNDRICPSTRALPPARPSLSPLPPQPRAAVALLTPSLPPIRSIFHSGAPIIPSIRFFVSPSLYLVLIVHPSIEILSLLSVLNLTSRLEKEDGGPRKKSIFLHPAAAPVVNFTVAEPRVFFLSRCEARRRDPVGPPPSFLPPSSTTMVVAAASRCSSEVLARLALRKPSLFGFSRGSSDKGGRVYTGVWGGEGLGKGEAICGDGAGQLQPHEIRGLDRRGTSLPGMCFL